MPEWAENLSGWSLNELQAMRTENRARAKELRLKSASLINKRLAKEISLEDYMSGRQSGTEAAAECKRRAIALENEIAARQIHAAR
jgi:hypothetical protein